MQQKKNVADPGGRKGMSMLRGANVAWGQFEPVENASFHHERLGGGSRGGKRRGSRITVPPSACSWCLRQLSSQPVLSLSSPGDHLAVLSWGFRKLLASDFTLELSGAAAQPRLPKCLLRAYKSVVMHSGWQVEASKLTSCWCILAFQPRIRPICSSL